MTRLLLTALVLVACVLAGPGTRSSSAEDVTIKIQEDADIEQVLKQMSSALDVRIVWDPNDKQIRGKRVSDLDFTGSRADVFSRLRALLTFYELVMIPVGPGSDTLLVMDARRSSSILKLKAEFVRLNDGNLAKYEGQDGLFITTTIQVQHMTDLRNARNALTRIVTGQNIGNVTEVPDANAFVVTDFAPNVVAIYRLLKEMDQPPTHVESSGPVFRAVKLEYANSLEAASSLSALFPTRIEAATQKPMVSSATRVIRADPRTNQILVTAPSHDMEQILEAAKTLDTPTAASKVSAHMIHLEHANADRAAAALHNLIRTSPALWQEDEGNHHTRPSVVSSEGNTLLISAGAKAFESIRRLVAEMDEAAKTDDE